MSKRINGPIPDRFWPKVNKGGPDDCWEWAGSRCPEGYGRFRIDSSTVRFAHRISYQLANGNIPKNKFVCHRCDNPPCVNPAHLFAGTHNENVADCVSKGRTAKGRTKRLTAEEKDSIWNDLRAGMEPKQIARKYSVGIKTAHKVARQLA